MDYGLTNGKTVEGYKEVEDIHLAFYKYPFFCGEQW